MVESLKARGVAGAARRDEPRNAALPLVAWAAAGALMALSAVGCASPSGVADLTWGVEIGEPGLSRDQERVGALAASIFEVSARAQLNGERLADVAPTVAHAEQRASEAEQLVKSGPWHDVVYVVDGLGFSPGSAVLEPGTVSLIDQLGERLVVENTGYYLEVYARDVDSGEQALNLARSRAESVRRYLHDRFRVPLHRIATMAGDCEPPRTNASAHADTPVAGEVAVAVLRQAVIEE